MTKGKTHHEIEKITEFDRAMHHIAGVPKETVAKKLTTEGRTKK